VPLEITTKVAALYPDSVFVKVAEAGHVALVYSPCAANLASEFIRTLEVGDTSCADKPEVVWPAVGRFPLLARDARPAEIDKTGSNQIGVNERKVATIAVAAATDAMQRSIIGSGTGVGLRGGTLWTDYRDSTTWTAHLVDCAFAQDVAVSRTVTWSPGSRSRARWVASPWRCSSLRLDHGGVGDTASRPLTRAPCPRATRLEARSARLCRARCSTSILTSQRHGAQQTRGSNGESAL